MYNLNDIKDIANGDQEFLRTLIKTFIVEVPPDANGLSEAVENGNAALAYQYALKLKPNLKSFGLNLDFEIGVIENWSERKTEQENAAKASLAISSTIHKVIKSLREDYSL